MPPIPDPTRAARRMALSLTAALLLCITIATTAPTPATAADPTPINFNAEIHPLLESTCFKCHGPQKQKGHINFSLYPDEKSALHQRKVWRKAIEQLESKEMPPEDETQPTPEQRERLLAWMKIAITKESTERDPGPALVRRLSLVEYNNTIRDLLGLQFDAAEAVGMTSDTAGGNSFGNLAAALDMPPAQLDKYFTAADIVLDRFFGTELSSSVDGSILERARYAREIMFGQKPFSLNKPETPVKLPDGISERDFAKQIISKFVRRAYRRPPRDTEIDELMKLYDHSAAGGKGFVLSVRFMLKAVLVSPKFLYRLEQDAPSGKTADAHPVSDHELAARLASFIWAGAPDPELLDLADQHKLTAPGPSTMPSRIFGTAIGSTTPPNNRDHLPQKSFDGDLYTFFESQENANVWVGMDLGEPREIRQIRYASYPREDMAKRLVGCKFQASPSADFSTDIIDLFTVATPAPIGTFVTQEVTASSKYRYVRFLSTKDAHGQIAEIEVYGPPAGTVLEQQVRRMLADNKARALTDTFAGQWLEIGKVFGARPSTEFFPDFNPEVRKAMYDETSMFFDTLRTGDRSVLELLDADYTYVNEELAKFYKIPGVTGKEMRRVQLKPEYHRGGLLGMGSVLALTSHTFRTSPTLRGKYILDVIFGTPPAPPPANAGILKDDQAKPKEPKSFRERINQHAADPTCASCHKKMDPLGFALDNFNAVGVWRDEERGLPIDTSGVLPTGEKLTGFDSLKQIVLKRRTEFTHNMTEQMFIYALGRELDYYDDGPVHEIQTALENNDYRYSAMVMGIAKSYPFQYRRNAEAGSE